MVSPYGTHDLPAACRSAGDAVGLKLGLIDLISKCMSWRRRAISVLVLLLAASTREIRVLVEAADLVEVEVLCVSLEGVVSLEATDEFSCELMEAGGSGRSSWDNESWNVTDRLSFAIVLTVSASPVKSNKRSLSGAVFVGREGAGLYSGYST